MSCSAMMEFAATLCSSVRLHRIHKMRAQNGPIVTAQAPNLSHSFVGHLSWLTLQMVSSDWSTVFLSRRLRCSIEKLCNECNEESDHTNLDLRCWLTGILLACYAMQSSCISGVMLLRSGLHCQLNSVLQYNGLR